MRHRQQERRHLLQGLAALGLGIQAGARPATAATAPPWSNWGGNQQCQPTSWLVPVDEAELVRRLPQAAGPVRAVGAGHSFTALVPTEGTLISLDRMTGVLAIDKSRLEVRVRAGTRLAQLEYELDAQGLALHNQPDIDMQSLAGALATGTHGTGMELPALHADVQALRLVTPQGEIISCSSTQRPELLEAARVSLGALGIVTEYTLRVRPRFMLRRQVWLERTESLLEKTPELARQYRHFELFVLPFTGYSAAITHAEVAPGAPEHPPTGDEDVLHDLQRLRDWLGRWPEMRRWAAARFIDPAQRETALDWSWRLLSTSRPTRFVESEYHLPRDAGIACLREVLRTLERHNEVFFPIEFRYVRADSAWLSPFHQRDSCSVATHAMQGEPYQYLLGDIGPVFRRHGGRPHWGKLHDMSLPALRALYPRLADFRALRATLDPQGRLLNPHLKQLLGGPDV